MNKRAELVGANSYAQEEYIDLGVDRSNKSDFYFIPFAGTSLTVLQCTGTAYVHLNTPNAPRLTAGKYGSLDLIFDGLYIENTAQSGKGLYLFLGFNMQARASQYMESIISAARLLQLLALQGAYTTAVEYDASGNPIYTGKAEPGSAQSDAAWQIKKITYDASGNPTDIKWASGNTEFDKVWNDRATYSYM